MDDFSAVKENTALEMATNTFNPPSSGSVDLEQHAGLENFDLMPLLRNKNAADVFYSESLATNQTNTSTTSSQNNHIVTGEQQPRFDKQTNFMKTSDTQHNTKVRVPEKNTEYQSEHNLNQEKINCVEPPSLTLPLENSLLLSESFSRGHIQNEASNSERVISNSLDRPVNCLLGAKSVYSERTHTDRKDELLDINVLKDNRGSNKDNLIRADTNHMDHVSPVFESSLHSASKGDTGACEHSLISLSRVENKLSSGVEISSDNSTLLSIETEIMETSSSSAPGSGIAQVQQSLQQGTNNDLNSSSNISEKNLNASSEGIEKMETDQTSEGGKNNSCDLLPNLSMQAHCDVQSSVLSCHNHDPDEAVSTSVFQKSSIIVPSGGQSENSVINKDNAPVSSSANSETNNLCKILTKYVFIDKKANHKSSRRGFGFPYRNSFRHFQKAKLRKAKHNKRNIKKSSNKVVKKSQKLIKKKTPTENNLIVTNLRKREHKQASDRSREERRKARELRKEQMSDFENISTDSEKNMKRNQKRLNKVANRKLAKGSTKKIHTQENHDMSEEENKTNRLKNRRLLSLDTKLAIIQAMENGGKTVKVGREFSVSRTNIWRIMKNKDEILAEKSGTSEPKKKKKYKLKEKNTTKEGLGNDEVSRILNEVSKDGEGNKSIESDLVTGSITKERLPRKDLTLEAKIQVVEALENGSKVVRLARQYGVSVSAISRINKNREYFKLICRNRDLSVNQKRARESKDPELDRVLLRWYRAIEDLQPGKEHISISNILLKEKAHSLALTMGKDYFASDNWILRWKNRHNIKSKINTISDRVKLKQMDEQVNISQILEELGQQEIKIDEIKREKLLKQVKKPDEFLICEHCGVLISRPNKRKKENGHLVGCPASAIRKDLTLEEKVQVVRALEHPGVKMVALAKKYGVSSSAISRIHKNRVDLLARQASGLANSRRRRDRGSKEPEVERVLCEWFKVQHELGIHTSGSMIREKARDIARVMGKDFWPSESWVFRWRHRNNVNDMNSILFGESEEEENVKDKGNDTENADDIDMPNPVQAEIAAGGSGEGEEDCAEVDSNGNEPKRRKTIDEAKDEAVAAKRPRMPRSVMCEKCGFVSSRIKNNRLKSIRHAKGCPDLKPRNELTYENRAKMVKALEEPGATLSSVARQFGVSVSSMSRMNQKKEHILTHGQDHGRQKKRIRDCKEPEVAANLYKWYKEKKDEGIHVTGPKLKEKAKKMAAEMGREFKASSGWLGRWRQRYNIVSSVKTSDKVISEPLSVRKKKSKKNSPVKAETEADHQLTQLQPIPTDIQPDNSIGSCASVIVEPLEPILPPPPQPASTQIFIHQRFQSPWELGQHPAAASVWPKEFMSTQAPSLQEEPVVPVTYAYPETIPKPIFHNMFEYGMSYQVAMPVDSTMLNRDFSKPDTTEAKTGSSATHTVPHATHPSHPQHNHHLPAGLTSQVPHMQHHIPAVGHQHHHPHTHQAAVNHNPQPPPSVAPTPSTSNQEEDAEQQRQVMEAFRIMSSFAQKKSLGDQVQAALRTIEMSMKNPQRKPSPRNTYTSI